MKPLEKEMFFTVKMFTNCFSFNSEVFEGKIGLDKVTVKDSSFYSICVSLKPSSLLKAEL